MAVLTRRRVLQAAALSPLLGCASGSRASRTPPTPFSHPEFAGRIGAAREDITPPVGIYARNWGAATHDVAEGIHRPLTLTVLTLQEDEQGPPLVLAAADLGGWRTKADEEYVRGALLDALTLDASRVMVNLSHTHAGPSTCREDRDKPGGHLIEAYLARVREALVKAARAALASAGPATLTWAVGRCDLAADRDLQDPDRDRWVTGFNPGAEADDTVLVGRAADASGRVVAVLVNYACHPTTMAWQNRLISPDYPGPMRDTVESQVKGALCLYLHGCSGEVAARETYTNAENCERQGRQLGYAALSTLEGMLPPRTRLEYAGVVESGAPLATWRRGPSSPPSTLKAVRADVDLRLKELPSVAQIEAALAGCEDRVLAERLRRKRRVRQLVGDGDVARVPLWVWRVGDAYLVGQPNEAYSFLQTELRRTTPGRAVVAMNLVNGSIGYLPRETLYGRDLYQVWQSPFDRGSLERVTAAARRAIQELGG
ncbi:MAG TPA: hypothetical protein VEJ18_16530 [Planctomycetota bacterium]|nr:hypothetical protein [Planctomycetota bacterium]